MATKVKDKRAHEMEDAHKQFQQLRVRLEAHGSPLDTLTKEEVIAKIRKTRKELWESKIAAGFCPTGTLVDGYPR